MAGKKFFLLLIIYLINYLVKNFLPAKLGLGPGRVRAFVAVELALGGFRTVDQSSVSSKLGLRSEDGRTVRKLAVVLFADVPKHVLS